MSRETGECSECGCVKSCIESSEGLVCENCLVPCETAEAPQDTEEANHDNRSI